MDWFGIVFCGAKTAVLLVLYIAFLQDGSKRYTKER